MSSARSSGTGLDDTRSDWLLGIRLDLPNRLGLTGRALVSDAFEVSKADIKMRYGGTRFDVETGFLYLAAAPSENRPDELAEWTVDATWRIDSQWTGRADWRYDVEAGRATTAGIGFGWRNECVNVDLSLSRRFTSSNNVTPSTDFNFTVQLAGFGGSSKIDRPAASCVY